MKQIVIEVPDYSNWDLGELEEELGILDQNSSLISQEYIDGNLDFLDYLTEAIFLLSCMKECKIRYDERSLLVN